MNFTPNADPQPVSRDKMTVGVSDLLAGKKATSDTPDVPEGVDADVWAKAQASAHDPQSADYDLASALLVLAKQLADLKSQDGAPQP
jgi:hypothetical protein